MNIFKLRHHFISEDARRVLGTPKYHQGHNKNWISLGDDCYLVNDDPKDNWFFEKKTFGLIEYDGNRDATMHYCDVGKES